MARASRPSWLAVALALGGCSLLEIGTPEAIDAGRSDAAEPDAAEPDAAEPDAAIDAGPIDTPANDCCTGPTYAGTLDVYEAKVLAAGGGFVGQGIVARLSFTSSEFPGAQTRHRAVRLHRPGLAAPGDWAVAPPHHRPGHRDRHL